MPDMKFSLPGPDIITLSGQTVKKLLRSGDGDAALLYLHMLQTGGKSTSEETMAALGKGLGWINSAMATLSRLGLIHLEKNVGTDFGSGENTLNDNVYEVNLDEPDESRRPSVDEIKREIESGSDFSIVVEETQKSLGKILSSDDLERLFGIYGDLSMPAEVILQLITFCISECKRRGSGRAPNMRYIEKVAYTWAREGILTFERAEEYIKNLEALRGVRGEIKSAMKIRDREFSTTEKKYVDKWIAMGFEVGAVEIAFDRTLVKTGKLAWNYMDSIMSSWDEKGIHTAKEIAEKDSGYSKNAKSFVSKNKKRFVSAPNQEEMNYMQRVLEKTKNG